MKLICGKYGAGEISFLNGNMYGAIDQFCPINKRIYTVTIHTNLLQIEKPLAKKANLPTKNSKMQIYLLICKRTPS